MQLKLLQTLIKNPSLGSDSHYWTVQDQLLLMIEMNNCLWASTTVAPRWVLTGKPPPQLIELLPISGRLYVEAELSEMHTNTFYGQCGRLECCAASPEAAADLIWSGIIFAWPRSWRCEHTFPAWIIHIRKWNCMIELTGINEEEAHVTLAPGRDLKASW